MKDNQVKFKPFFLTLSDVQENYLQDKTKLKRNDEQRLISTENDILNVVLRNYTHSAATYSTKKGKSYSENDLLTWECLMLGVVS